MLDERRRTVPCEDHADVVGDRYRLGPVLRRSAGCCAHRAYDDLLQRTVSVTLVAGARDSSAPFSLAPQGWLERGPEVAEVYDAGSEGDHLFLVTQHPEGPTLAETTPPGGLDVREVRDLGTAVAAALLPRHRHGAVHGGLGAGTVAWSPGGASLADFGLLPWLARWGEVPVAPPFPAPEQRRGSAEGPATDVYALGRLLGELAPEHGMRPGLQGLLADMTAESPAARPALDEVLRRLASVGAARRPLRAAGLAARCTLERHGRRIGVAAAACCIVGLGVGLAAAGTAPAAPGGQGATLAAAAPAAAPPFALPLQMPDPGSSGTASSSAGGSRQEGSGAAAPVADAADQEASGGSDASHDSHSTGATSSGSTTDHGSSGGSHTASSSGASSDADQQDAPAKPARPMTPPEGSGDHRSHGLGSVLGDLPGSPPHPNDGAKRHGRARDDDSTKATPKHDDSALGAFGV